MGDTVIYDIETYPSIIKLNGNENEIMLMSVAVTFDYKSLYKIWFENEVKELITFLLKFDKIVGFAIKNFDNAILDQYKSGAKTDLDAKSLDLLEIIESRLGHKVSLNNIAEPTLKLKKSGDGQKAIDWWLNGEKNLVIDYCKNDVKITKKLYEYGHSNKEIYFNSFGEVRKLKIDWDKKQQFNTVDFVYTLVDEETGKEIQLDAENKEFFNALELVKTTNKIVYLSGKAGTGKTTFLKYLKKNVNKNTIVLAYTGVAAINAGGQTINSFFQINPFDPPFLPDDTRLRLKTPKGDSDLSNIFNTFTYNDAKKELLESLELLVIDEVSMVRADLIDAIDNILRAFSGKNKYLPFGGIQVVLIGDTFQLSPIEGNEWKILEEFYGSPFFFSSKVFQENPPIFIELEIIYRQKQKEFINLLNRIRINQPLQEDLKLLNSKIQPLTDSQFDQKYVVLCSTNSQVNEINSSRLHSIKGKEHCYKGEIIDDFSSGSGITDLNLILKEGAQIMFLKNSNHYYNGKIGKIEKLSEDGIVASTTNNLGETTKFVVEKATWLNVKYVYDRKKHKIEQEVVGSFTQYPIKLAWAITVHKSQGLTFDKVIININDFSPNGLIYVALSRCTSLNGLILAAPIHRDNIKTDKRVIEFSKSFNSKAKKKDDFDSETVLGDLKLKRDNDKIGKFYFKCALSCILKKQYTTAYNYILKGYEFIVCDCYIGDWFNSSPLTKLLTDKLPDCRSFQLNFLKAFLNFYAGDFSRALESIDKYIEHKPFEEIGYYLKGRILNGSHNSIEYLNKALDIKCTPRTLYRIGRQTEDIKLVYKAAVEGFQSGCCLGLLAGFTNKKSIKLKSENLGYFSDIFNGYSPDLNSLIVKAKFSTAFHDLLNVENLVLADGNAFSIIEELEDFKNVLNENIDSFLTESINKSPQKPLIEWIDIPAGTFIMGSPKSEAGRVASETPHQVTLRAYKMSKYTVTFEQYDIFCLMTGREKPFDKGWGRGNRPVGNISWDDAIDFANWLGCRLPSEAEWEYACRAGTITPFNTGNNLASSQANCDGSYFYSNDKTGVSRKKTTLVGSFSPNDWGLFDMHGNVWEWCSDWHSEYTTIMQTNPLGPASGSRRIIRGGSFYNRACECRVASRGLYPPGTKEIGLGFRLALDE